MFKVLIADDEPSVIQSLKRSIDWSSIGLEVAVTCANGNEVIEQTGKQKIDIALLDIRMPGISGLEICDKLRESNKEIQLIIISGYAEFSYAEKAIRYGVLGYCLKPLEYDEITKLLMKATKNLSKPTPPFLNTDLLDVLESGDLETLRNVLETFGLRQQYFYVAVSVGEDDLPISADDGLSFWSGRRQRGYFLTAPPQEGRMRRFLENPQNQGIGYKKESVGLSGLLQALNDCTAKAYQFFVDPSSRICGEINYAEADKWIGKIQQSVQKSKWDETCETLLQIEREHIEDFTVRSSLKLCNLVYSGSLFREEGTDYYIYSLRQLVLEYGTLTDMLKRLRDALQKIRAPEEDNFSFTNSAFMKLMKYIEKNYRNEISLTSAAQAMHMNPNYVSQLFKKEAGITFTHYIAQRRIEDAVQMLTMTRKTAAEISMEVGFNDYFYFLKTFKKIIGKTPSQYRMEA